MSKKKNLMDGYFDQFKDSVADINPHVAAMVDAIIESDPPPGSKTEVKDDDVSVLKERRHIVEISQPERRHKGGQNVELTQQKRSKNAVQEKPERRHKGGQNVELTQQKRRQERRQNVGMETGLLSVDPTLLVGVQRMVFKYFLDLAQQFASMTTPRLTLESISSSTGLLEAQIHAATKQLRKKGCIVLSQRKDGRGGWVEYTVTQFAFDLWVRLENKHERSKNVELTQQERRQERRHKAGHEAPSSSRDINFKESTTTQNVDNFSNIDLGPVQHLGVTASVLARCIELYPNLQVEQLENLVTRFSEFMRDPKNKVQNARGFFISLSEQASKGQVPLDHIETPDERLMRLFIEQQKEAKAQKIDAERAAQEFDCEAWLESLDIQTQLLLVPETPFLKVGTQAYTAMLKNHFVENLWPERRLRILETEVSL